MIEIDVVLELILTTDLDVRTARIKKFLAEADVTVANIFRRQRQQNTPLASIRALSGKQVEQGKKGRLTAVCYGNIFAADRPAAFVMKE